MCRILALVHFSVTAEPNRQARTVPDAYNVNACPLFPRTKLSSCLQSPLFCLEQCKSCTTEGDAHLDESVHHNMGPLVSDALEIASTVLLPFSKISPILNFFVAKKNKFPNILSDLLSNLNSFRLI